MGTSDDYRDLLRDMRAALGAHARAGVFAAPGGASMRPVPTGATPPRQDDQHANPGGAPIGARRTLAQVQAELGDCQRCGLAQTRKHIVFGAGSEAASLVFIGEGPGADEDRTGVPFVGRAGELLDKMIGAMGWHRDDVYIANVIKCRPPENRTPSPTETAACRPFLLGQLDALAPRLVVALGRPAANALLENDAPISTLRGQVVTHRGLRILPTFHPAYLLRQPEKKREAWDDLRLAMRELASMGIVAPRPPNGRITP